MKQVLLWLFLVLGVAGAVQATGVADRPANVPGAGFSFALIGDLPYGDEQVVRFERLIDEINRKECLSMFSLFVHVQSVNRW
jgi:hypothetical protein